MLVSMLYHVDPVKGPTGNTKVAFDKLSVQQDGKIEFWEFELFNKAFPSLFFPAFRLQVRTCALQFLCRPFRSQLGNTTNVDLEVFSRIINQLIQVECWR